MLRAPRSHAVVLGSGMAGLAAAGVLAPCFERVTVLERDPAPGEGEARKGVPQGRHVHILLKAGENGLGEIFPGLADELEANGSHRIDFGNDFGWFHHGVWKVRHESGITLHMQSRPLLESIVRRRVEGFGNVAFRYGTAAVGIEIANGRSTAVQRTCGTPRWTAGVPSGCRFSRLTPGGSSGSRDRAPSRTGGSCG